MRSVKRWRLAAAVLLSLLIPCMAFGELRVEFLEGEAFFPEKGEWFYRYSYRIPHLLGDEEPEVSIREYYDTALSEMQSLVLPMYAADPDMIEQGKQEISQEYRITCNNERFFSTLMTQTQTIAGEKLVTLQSQVFASSGEYMGETLTLRGLLMVGDSSEQLSDLVVEDVFLRIKAMRESDPAWLDADLETFGADFYPETQFYADEDGRAVFYLQPGQMRNDDELMTFSYSSQEMQSLIDAAD